jgi:hypothetical protein
MAPQINRHKSREFQNQGCFAEEGACDSLNNVADLFMNIFVLYKVQYDRHKVHNKLCARKFVAEQELSPDRHASFVYIKVFQTTSQPALHSAAS